MLTTLQMLIRDERGAQLVEYGLLASLIAVVALTAVGAFGKSVSTLYAVAASSI